MSSFCSVFLLGIDYNLQLILWIPCMYGGCVLLSVGPGPDGLQLTSPGLSTEIVFQFILFRVSGHVKNETPRVFILSSPR